MSKQQKILTTVLWGVLVVLMVGIVVSRQRETVRASEESLVVDAGANALPEVLFPTPSFKLFDQYAKPFGSDDLKGKVWVAEFIFTHCAGPCPMMLGKMKSLQKNVADPNVHLVSFTVDPERDTPKVLKEKADELHADPARWHFLTGTKEQIESVAEGMKLATRVSSDEQQVLHSERFLLFDAKGDCRGVYDSKAEADMQKLRARAQALVAERGEK